MTNHLILGNITMEQQVTRAMNIRAEKYEIIDYLNQMTNTILSSFPNSESRDTLLMDLKRAKELVNNL